MLYISPIKYLKVFKLMYSKLYYSTATLTKPKHSSCRGKLFSPYRTFWWIEL